MSTFVLRGTAFITGAGSGIGQYTAYAFAKHGIRSMALCDIRPSALETTISTLKSSYPDIKPISIEMDVSSEASVIEAISSTIKAFGRIDIAVNNAGIGGSGSQTTEMGLAEWQNVVNVNLGGVFLCQRAEIVQMLKQEPLVPPPRGNRGVIVNVASMLGLVAASPHTPASAYAASKHAVVGLTRTDGVMYASQGVRINAICPGYVGTPLLKAATKSAVMQNEVAKTAMGRLGEMEEIADSIVYLASDMSSFMAGAALVVDGGYTAQ